MRTNIYLLSLLILIAVGTSHPQTNELTYQGKLVASGTAANTPHDFEFHLCPFANDCTTPLQTKQRLNVPVSNGVFTVKLDFDEAHFSGSDRWLEIAVRPAGGSTFTPLSPRQLVTSAPYSIKSLNSQTATTATNATQLGGVDANQYVVTTDLRMNDERNPLPNSSNYIQNNPSVQQTGSFNVSGNGTAGGTLSANVVNATTQFNIRGARAFTLYDPLGFGDTDTFAGSLAGIQNTTGRFNSFFGCGAGQSNTGGTGNSFFGCGAGGNNTGGGDNAFFGRVAGQLNAADHNSFFGGFAGQSNVSGSKNTIIGFRAEVGANNLTNATALGALSQVAQSNSLVLGSINGINGATADTKVGIGTTTPTEKLEVVGNIKFSGTISGTGMASLTMSDSFDIRGELGSGAIPASGCCGARMMFYPGKAAFRAGYAFIGDWDDANIGIYSTAMGARTMASGERSTAMGSHTTASGQFSTAMGMYASTNNRSGSFVYGDSSTFTTGTLVTASAAHQWTIRASGGYRFFTNSDLTTGVTLSPGGGSWTSVSDRNVKDNIHPVDSREVLKGVLRLPISTWNYRGQPQFRHIGAMAQDFHSIFRVGESDKTITTVDPDGVALAAIQGLNEKLNEELKERDSKIERQQQQIDALKKLICAPNPAAEICKPEK